MSAVLDFKDDEIRYNNIAAKIKNGVNQYLWQENKGYFGQFYTEEISKSFLPI
ncbi:MAG: hypothetical protein ABIR50_05705 [Ginsengibacter sp.]